MSREREILHEDRLDFSRWFWGDETKNMVENWLKSIAEEVAGTLAENLKELIYAQLHYDHDRDEFFIEATLQGDDRFEKMVQVRHSLVEEAQYIIDDNGDRHTLECISRTFLQLHQKAQEALEELGEE
jgi:hypothetical protein